jgi:colanic acid/amylovoran biosynthesis protein
LRSLAAELRAPVVSIPIETKREDSDVIALQTIIPPDICQNANFAPNEPLEVIQEIAKCRAIITGSYHAGVFALAMGIPVVALVKSEYYADKFFGLQKQFGSGMAIIELDAPDPAAALSESVRKLWAEAAGFREKLWQAADGQIAEGRRAFREFFGQLR